jgi:hypothetical protein
MLVAVALLALVLPSRMIAAAPARMILGSGGRSKRNNGENGKNATRINHSLLSEKLAFSPALIQVRWFIGNLRMLALSASSFMIAS